MEVSGWDQRYRSAEASRADRAAEPTPLVMSVARARPPARALDLACGAGRNALWLAQQGWQVTAVDGSAAALAILRERAAQAGLRIDARKADLARGEYKIAEGQWDLIVIAYYLQRDLFAPAERGLARGGALIAIVHTTEGDEAPTAHRLQPGELPAYFPEAEVLHSYEGKPNDAAHRRAVAEIVVRRP